MKTLLLILVAIMFSCLVYGYTLTMTEKPSIRTLYARDRRECVQKFRQSHHEVLIETCMQIKGWK